MDKLPNIHPGDVLREEFLIPMGMTAYRLAQSIGMQQTAVGEILNGKRGITPATALKFGRFFGIEPEFWLNLQAAYDLEEERDRLGGKLEAIEPCDLDEVHRQRIRELEGRRQRLYQELEIERARAGADLEAIQPCEMATA
jgi:addiction module HigA family antidote